MTEDHQFAPAHEASRAPRKSATASHVVLVAIGTFGDILPFLGLGRALSLRGHHVTLLSNANQHFAATRFGLNFEAIAPENPPQNTMAPADAYASVVAPSFRASARAITRLSKVGAVDVVVAHDLALGALSICEKLTIPLVRVVLAPCGLASPRRESSTTSTELRIVNDLRSDLALPPIGALSDFEAGAALTLAMFDHAFWGESRPSLNQVIVTGFPFVSDFGSGLDPTLETFLQRARAPVVFTPGTGVDDVGFFFATAAEACTRLGFRAVFLSPHLPDATSEQIACRAFVDLAELLPRTQALVHHGGVGTTAQGLRAGLPQLVRPERFDQPDNAARMVALGLGALLSPERFTADNLTASLERLVGSAAVAVRARRYALTMRHDALDVAAGLVQRVVSQPVNVGAHSGLLGA